MPGGRTDEAPVTRPAEGKERTAATAHAFRFIIFVGVVSLFADMTYEGARSISGPFLAVLGASGTVVGLVAGGGELLGYLIRFVSGRWSDATRQYWAIAFAGYAINLLAVPLLALAGGWVPAAGLLLVERLGKGIRSPARDVLLSSAAEEVGSGWGFGLHEALDQTGAVVGPLALALVAGTRGGYRTGFALLAVPAVLSLLTLTAAWRTYRTPEHARLAAPPPPSGGFARPFLLYMAAAGLVALGFADFPLIAYRLHQQHVVTPQAIPISYALAMVTSAVAALVFGRLFDRVGMMALVPPTLLAALFAPLAFLGGPVLAFTGIALWGVGMGAHESVMRAAVSGMAPAERRGAAFGTFNAVYGVAWFAGSAMLGILYDWSIPTLVGISVGAQVLAIPLLLAAARVSRRSAGTAAPAEAAAT
jgi:MFS family permease